MIRIPKPVLIGLAGFTLGLAGVVAVRLDRRSSQPPAAVPAKAASLAPDPRLVYKVELDDAPVRGPDSALVTIVQFSSYACPRCREVEDEVTRLADATPGLIRVAWKDLPLSADGNSAARAARAAARQEKFWELHDRLMRAPAPFDESAIFGEAQAAGVDVGELRAAIADPALEERLRADAAQALRFAIQTPPVIFVNGKVVPDPTPAALSQSIAEARTFASGLVTEGTPADKVYAALMRGALGGSGPISAMPSPEDSTERPK